MTDLARAIAEEHYPAVDENRSDSLKGLRDQRCNELADLIATKLAEVNTARDERDAKVWAALTAEKANRDSEYPPPYGHDCRWCGECTEKMWAGLDEALALLGGGE